MAGGGVFAVVAGRLAGAAAGGWVGIVAAGLVDGAAVGAGGLRSALRRSCGCMRSAGLGLWSWLLGWLSDVAADHCIDCGS